MEDKPKFENLLVPVRHPDDVNRITKLASALVDRGKITFLTVIEKGNFISTQKDWRHSTAAIDKHRREITKRWVKINPKIRYSDSVWEGIIEQSEEEDSDLILLGWSAEINFRSLRQKPMERVFANSNRDVAAFRSHGGKIHDIKKIMFPLGYKDYDYSKRLAVTAKLIEETDAECVFVHVLGEGGTEEDAEEIFEGPRKFMEEWGIECKTDIIRHEDVAEALIEESENYDLIVLGPSREYVFSRYMFGWLTDGIVNNADCSALVYKEGEHKWKAWIRGVFSGFKNELTSLFR